MGSGWTSTSIPSGAPRGRHRGRSRSWCRSRRSACSPSSSLGWLTTCSPLCERWQTGAARIGEVTETGRDPSAGRRRGRWGRPRHRAGRRVPAVRPGAGRRSPPGGSTATGGRSSRGRTAPRSNFGPCWNRPNVASKRWAFEQYDSIVQSRTLRRPEAADAAVLALPESDRAIAVAIDGNERRVACDPYRGTVEAVLECASNLACVGAEPLGVTNCLNFGNPEKPPTWPGSSTAPSRALADACDGARGPGRGGKRLPLQRKDRRRAPFIRRP